MGNRHKQSLGQQDLLQSCKDLQHEECVGQGISYFLQVVEESVVHCDHKVGREVEERPR